MLTVRRREDGERVADCRVSNGQDQDCQQPEKSIAELPLASGRCRLVREGDGTERCIVEMREELGCLANTGGREHRVALTFAPKVCWKKGSRVCVEYVLLQYLRHSTNSVSEPREDGGECAVSRCLVR